MSGSETVPTVWMLLAISGGLWPLILWFYLNHRGQKLVPSRRKLRMFGVGYAIFGIVGFWVFISSVGNKTELSLGIFLWLSINLGIYLLWRQIPPYEKPSRRPTIFLRSLQELADRTWYLGEQQFYENLMNRWLRCMAIVPQGFSQVHSFVVRHSLGLILLGFLLLLATVFANPAVVELGPSIVYPLDIGGMKARMNKSGYLGSAGRK